MITDGQRCHVCRGKMSKPKVVPDGPEKGRSRIYCLNCGYMVYVTPVSIVSGGSGQSEAKIPEAVSEGASGEPSLVLRNGQWEIVEE